MPIGRLGFFFFFFFSDFIVFINWNVQGGGVFFLKYEKNKNWKGGGGVIWKKKEFQSAHFSPPGWWTGNNFLFKGGLKSLA